MKKAAPKVTVTPQMLEIQNNLIAFLKQNPEIKATRLRPYGHAIDISTVPESKSEEFLRIVHNNKL